MLRRSPNGFEISRLLSLLIHFVHFVLWRILLAGPWKCVQMQPIRILWTVFLLVFLNCDKLRLLTQKKKKSASRLASLVSLDVLFRCVLHACFACVFCTSGQLSDLSFLLHNFSLIEIRCLVSFPFCRRVKWHEKIPREEKKQPRSLNVSKLYFNFNFWENKNVL